MSSLKRPADFYAYQPKAIEFVKQHRYCALWVGMRLGKTISVLSALQDLIDNGTVGRILVVAPLRVSINSWPEDLESWAQLTLTYRLIRGTDEERRQQLAERDNVHIINHELVPWLVETIGKDDWPYDCLIIDESRKYKNHNMTTKTKHLSRFGALCLVRPKIRRVIELTGTPAPNSYHDLWAQIFLLDGGRRLQKNITRFRKRYCSQGFSRFVWDVNPEAQQPIREAISDLVFVVDEADTVDLPELLTNDVNVELPKDARHHYDTLKREYITQLHGKDLVTLSSPAKNMKLLQMASGRVYLDDGTEVVHREKEQALEELCTLLDGPKLVIYNFVFEREWILAKYSKAKLLDSKPSTVRKWNAGEIDMLVMHPASGGHGLNLYQGGDDIIWVSPTWDLELWEQTNQRLSHPSKSNGTIRLHVIRAKQTIEEAVFRALKSKTEVQQYLLEELRKSPEKIL